MFCCYPKHFSDYKTNFKSGFWSDWFTQLKRRPVNISTCWLTVGRQRLGTQTHQMTHPLNHHVAFLTESADRKYLIVYPLDGGNIHVVGGGAHIFILLVGEDVDANQVNLKGRWGIHKCLNKENRSYWKQHNSNWSTCQCHASHQPGDSNFNKCLKNRNLSLLSDGLHYDFSLTRYSFLWGAILVYLNLDSQVTPIQNVHEKSSLVPSVLPSISPESLHLTKKCN